MESVPQHRSTYIYGLHDPRDGSLRYIGKTKDPEHRIAVHLALACRGNSQKDAWLRELMAAGTQPDMVLIEECTSGTWPDRERFWVKHHHEAGCDLLNTWLIPREKAESPLPPKGVPPPARCGDTITGAWLRYARRKKGWSQDVLQAESGVSKSAISRIESGHIIPDAEQFRRLTGALGANRAAVFAMLVTDLARDYLADHDDEPHGQSPP